MSNNSEQQVSIEFHLPGGTVTHHVSTTEAQEFHTKYTHWQRGGSAVKTYSLTSEYETWLVCFEHLVGYSIHWKARPVEAIPAI